MERISKILTIYSRRCVKGIMGELWVSREKQGGEVGGIKYGMNNKYNFDVGLMELNILCLC